MGKNEVDKEIASYDEQREREDRPGKFEEMYNKAKDGGKVDQATFTIWKPEEEGERIIGNVVKVEPFEQGTFDTEVNQYLISTDRGLVSTVLGSATDKQLDKWELTGKLICITYHGKNQLSDGRQVNNYQVEVF